MFAVTPPPLGFFGDIIAQHAYLGLTPMVQCRTWVFDDAAFDIVFDPTSGTLQITTVASGVAEFFAPSGLPGATAASRYVGATVSGLPSGSFSPGDFIVDQTNGTLWVDDLSGTWRKLAKDADAVHLAGAENVTGVKTFTAGLVTEFASVSGLAGATQGARLVGATASGSPASGTFLTGDVIVDVGSGTCWVCTAPGGTGTWSALAVNSLAAHLAGIESFTGLKTFSAGMIGAYLSASGITGATAGGRIVGATASGAPVTGTFLKGDMSIDQTGIIWICTVAGSPGTWAQVGGATGTTIHMVPAATMTTDFTTVSSSMVDVTGLSCAFTTTASATAIVHALGSVGLAASSEANFQMLLDGVTVKDDGTHVAPCRLDNSGGSGAFTFGMLKELTGLSAGSHTVKLQVKTSTGTLSIRPGSGGTGFENGTIKVYWY